MKIFNHNGYQVVLVHSKYENNNLPFIGYVVNGTGEPYVDVSCNTPYNTEGTITLSHDFTDICKDLADEFVKEYCTNKICDIESGYVTLPMYQVDMKKLLADSIEL